MKGYYELLKNNIIDFDKLMLEKYYLLGLNEIDTIILIKLNNLLKHGEQSLSLSTIVPFMSISETECSERIATFVENGFISLEMATVKARETFSLDETYKKLSLVLSNEEENKENDEINNMLKQTITLLEKGTPLPLSNKSSNASNALLRDRVSSAYIQNIILTSLLFFLLFVSMPLEPSIAEFSLYVIALYSAGFIRLSNVPSKGTNLKGIFSSP